MDRVWLRYHTLSFNRVVACAIALSIHPLLADGESALTSEKYNPEMVEKILAADKAEPEATIKAGELMQYLDTPTQAQIEAALEAYKNVIDVALPYRSREKAMIAAITAAAEVRQTPLGYQQLREPSFREKCDAYGPPDTAAAEVGFSIETYRALPEYDPETIERCAQIVETFGGHNVPLIAAAIRALKDKP